MKREELDVCSLNGEGIETWMVDCEGTEIWTTDSNGNKYYYKSQADKVMDDLEAQVKNLEKANAELIKRVQELEDENNKLEADAELDQKKRLMLCNGYNKKCERVKELEATISILETTQKWISVKNRLPNESTFVKVKLESGTKRKMMYVDGNWFDCNEFLLDNEEDKVTHWKSLPPPPTTEESSGVEKEK